jgi:hypothetical protein
MKNWFRRRDRARGIHEEVESHLAMRTELNRSAGMSPEAAGSGARRQFGNAALIEEDVRHVRGFRWLESLAQDARYALRGFARSPVFTVTAVVTIALGIGASTAVFSLVDRILGDRGEGRACGESTARRAVQLGSRRHRQRRGLTHRIGDGVPARHYHSEIDRAWLGRGGYRAADRQ